jgi:hypothetical protein
MCCGDDFVAVRMEWTDVSLESARFVCMLWFATLDLASQFEATGSERHAETINRGTSLSRRWHQRVGNSGRGLQQIVSTRSPCTSDVLRHATPADTLDISARN